MTNNSRDPKRPNDPLADALRNEVPAPGASYWEQIDARLAAAAEEAGAPQESVVVHLDHVAEDRDTDDTVIRLTDMNTTAPSPTNRTPVLLALAATAALIAGVIGFSALRNDAPTTVEFAGDQTEQTPDAPADPDVANSTEGDGAPTPVEPEEADGPDVAEEPIAIPADAIVRRCFFEQYLPEDEPDPTVVLLVEIDGTKFRSLLEFPIGDGEVNQTFDVGTIDADGVGQADSGAVLRLFEGGAERSIDEFEPFTAAEVDCSSIPDVEERFARFAGGQPVIVPGPTEGIPEPTETPTTQAPTTEPPTVDEPAAENPIAEVPFKDTLIGLTEEAAQAAVEDAGFFWRVVGRDDEILAVTEDYSESRINGVIEDGIVTETSIG